MDAVRAWRDGWCVDARAIDVDGAVLPGTHGAFRVARGRVERALLVAHGGRVDVAPHAAGVRLGELCARAPPDLEPALAAALVLQAFALRPLVDAVIGFDGALARWPSSSPA